MNINFKFLGLILLILSCYKDNSRLANMEFYGKHQLVFQVFPQNIDLNRCLQYYPDFPGYILNFDAYLKYQVPISGWQWASNVPLYADTLDSSIFEPNKMAIPLYAVIPNAYKGKGTIDCKVFINHYQKTYTLEYTGSAKFKSSGLQSASSNFYFVTTILAPRLPNGYSFIVEKKIQ